MNIYTELNKIIEYIELHLEEKINYKEIAKMIGVNDYTFQRLFSLISNVTITEYIRNRRLSNAGQELYLNDEKIIDIAIKYQYDSPTSFSRAFEKFHGIKPSQVKKKPEKLKMYTKIHFKEESECNKNVEYKIITKEQMLLYGKYKSTTTEKIRKDAPDFFEKMDEKYGYPTYGMVEYEDQERRKAWKEETGRSSWYSSSSSTSVRKFVMSVSGKTFTYDGSAYGSSSPSTITYYIIYKV
jgi:AraC-like DNA-binding protein